MAAFGAVAIPRVLPPAVAAAAPTAAATTATTATSAPCKKEHTFIALHAAHPKLGNGGVERRSGDCW
jgi:hypothetical protein